MSINENFNLDLQNEDEEFLVEFGETTVLSGGGGTSNFNELINRPKYDGATMTGDTNIPKVPTDVSELENDANYATGADVTSAVAAEKSARESADANIESTISGLSESLATETTNRTNADTALNNSINSETTARQNADNGLQSQIDAIVASSDVKDIVGTYAQLQAYDTSTLGDNDIIKVLQDETHSNETTYYRWSTATSSFTLIGEEGPYYTKSQTDSLLNAKQNNLTQGANIQIVGDTISATDTTYSPFTGTDGTIAGTNGLVPAPATTDANKFLKSDGTWAEAGGGSGVNVVQTTGTSTTDVMSQNAIYQALSGSGTRSDNYITKIRIGDGAYLPSGATGRGTIALLGSAGGRGSIGIGYGANARVEGSDSAWADNIALGTYAVVGNVNNARGAIALGAYSRAVASGEINVGVSTNEGGSSTFGYGNTLFRVIRGLHDGEQANDAVNVSQVNSVIDAINAALSTNIPHIGA